MMMRGTPKREVRQGQVFVDAKPPRREWRVAEKRGELFLVQRVDKPGVFRFQSERQLLDPLTYSQAED